MAGVLLALIHTFSNEKPIRAREHVSLSMDYVMGVALSWLVWYTTRLNAALLEARVQSSGLVLRYSGSTSCL